jgi:cation diffusion facilitator family transporter
MKGMILTDASAHSTGHKHVFLDEGHRSREHRTWAVIVLCSAMMLAETVGGLLFGSIALVADGLHMSTHAGALLLAALAYTYARKYADDPRFTFGTGKFGDLAAFTSAIALAMMAALIGYEGVNRILSPVPIHFGEAILIACLGLVVNVASAWLLSEEHDHPHDHAHEERGDRGGSHHRYDRPKDTAHRDNNIRAVVIHVLADAAVAVLVIVGLLLARIFGWLWMDPVAGIIGACVIAGWSYGLIRDTGAILLDMVPDKDTERHVRIALESEGDELIDFHIWRLGPGHLGVILSIITTTHRDTDYYRAKLSRMPSVSHLTIELSRKSQSSLP